MSQSVTSSIKKLSLALGVAGIGALMGLPALAQSSGETPEFELSKEGYIILCDRTPLNSRCEGSPYYSGSTGQSTDEDPTFSPDDDTPPPTETLPGDGDETDPSFEDDSLSPDDTTPDDSFSEPDSSGSDDDSMTAPDGTPVPTETLPGDGDETAPEGQSYDGMQDGSSSGL